MGTKDLNTILAVEDEEDIRKIIRVALENIGGFEVELCASADEALDLLSRKTPDLIILDVMMPGMDGPALLNEIRKDDSIKDIPVIFMTAKVQSHEVDTYRSLGVLDVISKPFDPVTLPEQVRDIWASMETI